MVHIDSPNIFWTRIKEIRPDDVKQMSFHDDPETGINSIEHACRFRYAANKRRINPWFDDPSMRYRLEGWWLD